MALHPEDYGMQIAAASGALALFGIPFLSLMPPLDRAEWIALFAGFGGAMSAFFAAVIEGERRRNREKRQFRSAFRQCLTETRDALEPFTEPCPLLQVGAQAERFPLAREAYRRLAELHSAIEFVRSRSAIVDLPLWLACERINARLSRSIDTIHTILRRNEEHAGTHANVQNLVALHKALNRNILEAIELA